MKGSVRYIITRPCLSEGSVRLLKYLDSLFPQDGPITLLDDRGAEHEARVSRGAGRVYGLHDLYHGHNLGVNDVLLITPLGGERYQVECVVKPISDRPQHFDRPRPADTPQRVVVSESPYVREVRFERRAAPGARPGGPVFQDAASQDALGARPSASGDKGFAGLSTTGTPAASETAVPQARERSDAASKPPQGRRAPDVDTSPGTPRGIVRAAAPQNGAPRAEARPAQAEASGHTPLPLELLHELAARVGYRVERLSEGVVRLSADLGAQSYRVIVALDLAATARPEWREEADYLAVLVGENERPQGLPRLTREALGALLENARLAPLTPIELRGYWNAGSFDLESAASVAELVSAQLSQRGVFSFVLLSLAQQSAHSVVSVSRLAERLGSGVNAAELGGVLQTLSSAPFSALSPLGGGQYYLRADVHDVLRGLGEYAEGLRVRLNAETRVPGGTR